MSCSALTGVMIADVCCNFRLPLQVDTQRAARTVAMFFSSDDVPACDHPDSGAGVATLSEFFHDHQSEGLEDLIMSPVPLRRVRVNNVDCERWRCTHTTHHCCAGKF